MNDFQQDMAAKLRSISSVARATANYTRGDDFEGCVLYENLLNLRTKIEAAITFYETDVPATDRASIVRMVEEDKAKH